MTTVNKAIILGNLGKDPELRYVASGDAVCNLSIATSERWKDKNGEQQERTEWHRVTLWRKQAELAGEYLTKGSKVYIEGEIQTRKWQDNDGNDRYSTEIQAHTMKFMGKAPETRDSDHSPTTRPVNGGRPPGPPATNNAPQDFDDDIPF